MARQCRSGRWALRERLGLRFGLKHHLTPWAGSSLLCALWSSSENEETNSTLMTKMEPSNRRIIVGHREYGPTPRRHCHCHHHHHCLNSGHACFLLSTFIPFPGIYPKEHKPPQRCVRTLIFVLLTAVKKKKKTKLETT